MLTPTARFGTLVCLLATAGAVSAQEKTASYQAAAGTSQAVQQINHTQMHFKNPYAYYEPGNYSYPNYIEPNRGYVYYGYTGRACCRPCGCPWLERFRTWQADCAAKRANFGHRFRCSLGFLRPLTYWDFGARKDIIAVDPGYIHPSDASGIYAAQGYGVPVSVPLPPNVRSSYNYSWGLPSSRLTPLAPPAGY